jgi:hypothetical protein
MNEDKWIKCTKCNIPIPPVFEPEIQDPNQTYFKQVDDGMKLTFKGGYSMFYDDIGNYIDDVFLCHDCMVELLNWFPESFREQFKGAHPYSHKPNGRCCEYAWSFKDDERDIE